MKSASELIENAGLVTQVYGHWPSFHDAEITSLSLVGDGPSIEAVVHAFQITNEVTDSGYFRLDHHRLITFRFGGVRNIDLAGWGARNPVMEILFDFLDEDEGKPRWRVTFEGVATFAMSLECDTVSVVSVTPTAVEPPELSASEARERMEKRQAALKRPTLAEQVAGVTDRASFMQFVEVLIEDRVQAVKSGGGDWSNSTISEYLAAAVAHAREWEPHGTFGLREEPSWHDYAWFLMVGRH